MTNRAETKIVPSKELKDRIATADLSGFIDLLAELIAEERIKENIESEKGKDETNTSAVP